MSASSLAQAISTAYRRIVLFRSLKHNRKTCHDRI